MMLPFWPRSCLVSSCIKTFKRVSLGNLLSSRSSVSPMSTETLSYSLEVDRQRMRDKGFDEDIVKALAPPELLLLNPTTTLPIGSSPDGSSRP